MRDLKFACCCDFSQVTCDVQSTEFHEAEKAFKENIARIKALAELPAEVNYWTTCFTLVSQTASQHLGVNEVTPELHAYRNELLQGLLKNRRDTLGDDPVVLAKHQWERGSQAFTSLLSTDGANDLISGTEALLSAMLTSAWAAFEALIVDLWTEAVNKHPNPLADRFIRKHQHKIDMNHLLGHGYDFRNAMGKILRQTGKVRLDNLLDIQNNYCLVFDNEWPLLWLNYPALRGVEAIRHLFAHRSGFVDQQFLKLTSGLPDIPKYNVGDRFGLDGEFVAKQVDMCIRCAVELLVFLDKWSQAHVC